MKYFEYNGYLGSCKVSILNVSILFPQLPAKDGFTQFSGLKISF